MQSNKNHLLGSIIVGGIMIFLVLTGILIYNGSLMQKLTQSTDDTLEEIMQQQAYNFSSKIESEKLYLETIAETISLSENVNDISIQHLEEIAKKSSFEYMSVADLEGNAINSSGVRTDLSDRDYFYQALAGETLLTEPIKSKIRDAMVIVLATPLKFNNKIIGVITGSYNARELDKLFVSSFGDKGYAFITNNDGKIIAKTSTNYTITVDDNYFNTLQNAKIYEGDSYATIKEKVIKNQSGLAKYDYYGIKRIMHYCTINVNNWNLFSVVPEEVIAESANKIRMDTIFLSLLLILAFLLFFLWNLRMQRESLKRISDIAFVDELTGAPTLAKFKLDTQRVLDNNPDMEFKIIKFDVDKFKVLNQARGYETGDKLLKSIAIALKQNLQSEYETYARVNVDEFIIFQQYFASKDFEGLRASFTDYVLALMGNEFNYSIKFPTGHYERLKSDDDRDISSLIEKVNFAHRKAKYTMQEICVYDEDVRKEAFNQIEIENKMEAALKNQEFKVFLQPKYRLNDETIAGAEALVRWKSQNGDVYYPNQFIPLFEKNGFITKLDFYMFEKSCEIIQGWIQKKITPTTISVNFSRNHLNNPDFVSRLVEVADRYQVPHEYLEIELTETAIFDHEDILIKVLDRLHEEGFTLSMDDFGTGYSSLGLLKNINVDVIKIDRGFFTFANNATRAKAVIANVMHLAKELKIHTVAEGVETKEHIELLKELGCDIVQGYYYAKPMPAEDLKL